MSKIVAVGSWGTVEWASGSDEKMPAREVFLALSTSDKAKVLPLFKRLAEFGSISNREKFRQLGAKAGAQGRGIWEFKAHQIRFFGDFRPGHRFIVVHGITDKKQDNLRKSDIETSVRVLSEHDEREGTI